MTYQAAYQLTADAAFGGRTRACATQQAEIFKDDQRPDYVALAESVMRSEGDPLWAFVNLTASAPGIAGLAGDPTDQALVTDADLLAAVQALWPVVAGLYFDVDGTPLGELPWPPAAVCGPTPSPTPTKSRARTPAPTYCPT